MGVERVEEGGREPARGAVFPAAELAVTCRRVPARPGVYLFRAADRQVLYVGTSGDLRRRLQSYFRAGAPRQRKEWVLLHHADVVEVRTSGSAFAALLEEIQLIQSLAPPVNRRLKAPERYVYLRVADPERFPYFALCAAADEVGRLLGPFALRAGLRRALEVVNDAFGLRSCDRDLDPAPGAERCWRADVGTCAAPCVARISAGAYGRQFARALSAIVDGGRRGIAALEELRDAHAAAERFEAAARVHRQAQAVRRLRRVLRPVELARQWDRLLVVQPAAGRVALWAVVGGSVAAHLKVEPAALSSGFEAVWTAAQRRLVGATAKTQVDAARIIRRWLRQPANRRWTVPVQATGRAAAWRHVRQLAARCAPLELWPTAAE